MENKKIKLEKENHNLEKINNLKKNSNLKNFFEENFSDSKILQKSIWRKFWEKMKEIFLKNKKLRKFFSELQKNFPDKKIFYKNILENTPENLELNIKNFEEIFFQAKKLFLENEKKFWKNKDLEINIFLENEKKYLEIVNCDLVFDFWDYQKGIWITLQSDEFLKMLNC